MLLVGYILKNEFKKRKREEEEEEEEEEEQTFTFRSPFSKSLSSFRNFVAIYINIIKYIFTLLHL